MKKISYILFTILAVCSLTSCLEDEYLYDYDDQKPVIEIPYYSSNTHTQTMRIPANKVLTTKFEVNYTIADWRNIKEQIPVVVDVDPSRLPAGAIMMPTSAYDVQFPCTVTIQDAETAWKNYKREEYNLQKMHQNITFNFDDPALENNKTYALPIAIKSVPAGYTISGNFGYMVFKVTMPK